MRGGGGGAHEEVTAADAVGPRGAGDEGVVVERGGEDWHLGEILRGWTSVGER